MSWAVEAQRAWQDRTSQELAQAWIASIVERTSLADLADLDLAWFGRESAGFVADLLSEVDAPRPTKRAAWAARARELVSIRAPRTVAAEVPRDLASLQRLLTEALSRNAGGQDPDELRDRLFRLALLFGELHSEFAQALVQDAPSPASANPIGALPGDSELRRELRRLVSAGPGAGPFAIIELDIDGLRYLNVAEGVAAGDEMLQALADGAREALGSGCVFRSQGDELVAVVPGADAGTAAALASRLSVAGVSIGVAAWPDHGSEPQELLERAREATYAAKASGERVAVAPLTSALQRS
jgi:diguanylate cyclase (GGDEF)-like protein